MSTAGRSLPVETWDAARCPHVLYRDVLGPPAVAALLDYVVLHRARFRLARPPDPADPGAVSGLGVYRGGSDFGRTGYIMPDDALTPELRRERSELRSWAAGRKVEISSYGDGGLFAPHLDTTDLPDRVRILSCVYYFARSPGRFSGGELRLHGFPSPSGEGSAPVVDVAPETDTLIAFPSWLVHQILPIRVPSATWADRRFAINCWIHRCA